jgi:hypothetical protein
VSTFDEGLESKVLAINQVIGDRDIGETMRLNIFRSRLITFLAPLVICLSVSVANSQDRPQTQQQPFRGGLNQVKDSDRPHPVRNDVAQPGDEIVTLRYFKIKKGSFDEFLRVSVEGVWPYFEKLGSRVIGMWKVIPPTGIDGAPAAESKEYDEVYLSTRYASLDHWKASRDAVSHGGNGPDWTKCKAALDRRNALTLSTNVIFLRGSMAPGGPYFMPGLDETYEKKTK